jgi:hypothetical protein
MVALALLAFNITTLLRHLPTRLIPRRLTYTLSTSLFGNFLPRWNFFAPTPGTYDYHLLYRNRWGDALVGSWCEIEVLPARPIFGLSSFWNPRRHEVKALVDVAGEISASAEELRRNPTSALGTVPYIALLSKVSSSPRLHEATHTQFLLLARATGESHVIMASAFHGLGVIRDEKG